MPATERNWQAPDAAAMAGLGYCLGQQLSAPSVIYLLGELGFGKTTLARGVLRAFGYRGAVKSPTYTLVEPYRFAQHMLYHFDLYRLDEPAELEYMGIRDYFDADSIVLVEWPQRGAGFLPAADILITITPDGPGRRLHITAQTQRGADCIEHLPAAPDGRK